MSAEHSTSAAQESEREELAAACAAAELRTLLGSDGLASRLVADRDLDAIEIVAHQVTLAIASLKACVTELRLGRLRRTDPEQDVAEVPPASLEAVNRQIDERLAPLKKAADNIRRLGTLGIDRWMANVSGTRPGQWTHELLVCVDEVVVCCTGYCSPVFDLLDFTTGETSLNALEADLERRQRQLMNLRAALEEQFADDDGREPEPSLDDEDASILRAMVARAPLRLTQDQIEAATTRPRICRRTIAERMPRLVAAGLAVQPRGKKQGYTITPAGRDMLAKIGNS